MNGTWKKMNALKQWASNVRWRPSSMVLGEFPSVNSPNPNPTLDPKPNPKRKIY